MKIPDHPILKSLPLPLLLLALMMVIGLALESVYYGGPQIWVKLPMAWLLAALAWKSGRRARGEDAARGGA